MSVIVSPMHAMRMASGAGGGTASTARAAVESRESEAMAMKRRGMLEIMPRFWQVTESSASWALLMVGNPTHPSAREDRLIIMKSHFVKMAAAIFPVMFAAGGA